MCPVAIGTDLVLHRLDAQSFARIVETGALDDQRVELLDGLLVDLSPHSPPHALVVQRLTALLGLAEGLGLRVQLPLEVAEDSVLEPDLALVAEAPSAVAHPRTARLVVEVAVTSGAMDRGRKADLYAAAGVDEYWIVDVPRARVEIRRGPAPDGYDAVATYRVGDVLPSPGEGVSDLQVAELLEGLVG